MKNAQKICSDIKFDGTEIVLDVVDKTLHEKKNNVEKFNAFMNKAIELKVSNIMVAVVVCSVVFIGNISLATEKITPYTITVVDERGHYETY